MIAVDQAIRELLDRTRSRWRRLLMLRASVRAMLAASVSLAAALVVASLLNLAPATLAVMGVTAAILVLASALWGLWIARDNPSDARLARFIEERAPVLDDRLASAVHLVASGESEDRPELAAALLADAGRLASSVDPMSIVPTASLRRRAFQAGAAAILLALVLVSARGAARRWFDALSLTLFPARITLEVTPGNARVQAGRSVKIGASLGGNGAPVVARLLLADGAGEDTWRVQEMAGNGDGRFASSIDAVDGTLRYRVTAGPLSSPIFTIAVVRPPRVKRIDIEYTYAREVGLPPRLEEDGGDIYAPEGTKVRVHVLSDRPAANGRLLLSDGKQVELVADGEGRLVGSLQVVHDNSYRLSLVDAEGLTSRGDTEYFIRTLEDRPPEVHVVKPARDRRVTRLEEVAIEAEAHDDFGVERLDLVYAVRGGAERVVPLDIPARSTSVAGRHTLYVEDLNVEPGDFVTYYARARDLPRGKRSSEARSDIFFLEVKPFDEEFTLAESQASGGGSGRNRQIDDLVAAQKEIIVATWKLDRRAQSAGGAKSEQDIKTVAAAQSELKVRVQQIASGFRASTMRDPRRRTSQGGRGGGQPGVVPGPAIPEEDGMTAAATAMGKAATSLSGLRTAEALPSEMEALNYLLRAQAEVKQRQVQRQQAGRGAGGNRSDVDLSTLFDRELARDQKTNYETPANAEQGGDQNASALDDIKDLARRQDELLQRQRDLARDRDRMTAGELKRELEKLTREQNELRQRAEELAQRMGQTGQTGQMGQMGRMGQTGQKGQVGQAGQVGRGAMREISEEMRGAASDLRRQDAGHASERSARALDKLRELERGLQPGSSDARRRALGDLQLEARQLADSERQIASEATRAAKSETARDAFRRLAEEQSRVADRTRRVQEGLKQQTGPGQAGGRSDSTSNLQKAAAEAVRELERQNLLERMQQSASALRAEADRGGRNPNGAGEGRVNAAAQSGREIARGLDRLADQLAAADPTSDLESRRLSGQLARARELRDRLDSLSRELATIGQPNGPDPTGSRLGDQLNREIQQVKELLEQLQRDDKDRTAYGGRGLTFEAPGNMVLSAPGTEAFKQDFAKWQELKQQATSALDLAASGLTKKLREKQSKDRLAAGVDDKAPAEYQQQVDSYFKALAAKKK